MKQNEEGKSKEVRGLENTVASLRAQMKLQQAQAQELAEAVLKAFEGSEGLGVCISLKDETAARRAYNLALAVLA